MREIARTLLMVLGFAAVVFLIVLVGLIGVAMCRI